MDTPIVVDLTAPEAVSIALCGGKGASLARLRQAAFPVPGAIVVTAEAYRTFIEADAQWRSDVTQLDFERAGVLREQCAAIRSRLGTMPLPTALEQELDRTLPDLLSGGPVSVRSSSTLEDLAGAAFAGQHDTYLNVTNAAAVRDCVRRCFASLWEDRAVRYRHERGFGQLEMAMAVVVQTMVSADIAGVAFSMNPITGDLNHLVLNATFGLGESVVSGEENVDQFVIDKGTGEVVERSIAEKRHAIVGGATGTETIELSDDRKHASSLTDAQIATLHELCGRVERFCAFPQDMEWAIAGSDLFLLQSRPVTQFPARWTRDESAERFPNAITPLTWDFTSDGFHESLAYSLRLLGLPSYEGKWFERFDCYVYGNQTAVELFTGGQQVAFATLDELRYMMPVIRERYRWVLELPVTWVRDLDRYLLRLGALRAVDTTALTEAELWQQVLRIDELGRDYFRPNIAISITQGVLHRTLFRFLALVVGPEQAPSLYDGLTGFCETKTNLVNFDLYRLFRLGVGNERLRTLLLETDRRELWEAGTLRQFPEFHSAFERFLDDHGHREVDFDAYHPTWVGQPWVVLENVRLMLLREDVQDPATRERQLRLRQQQSEETFLSQVPEDLRYFASELLRLARAYTALDDLEHYQTTRLSIPMRMAIVALGSSLQHRGVLDEPEDVFFLRKRTLASLMDRDIGDAAVSREARENKREYLRQRGTAPPHHRGEVAVAVGEGDLRGLPGSPGLAEGPVCLVRGVEDFARFPPGSVLVARTTNPAWTPLFYSACAVITESGGPLSHGAVTAREVGLPAVMGVRGALGLLRDGERVTVHGTAGTVTRAATRDA